MNNTHDVVQSIDPDARVIYVDHDLETVAHGQKLIANVDGVYYVWGDLGDSPALLDQPMIKSVLDWSRPVGLLIIGVAYFLPGDPWACVGQLIEAAAPGSFLALSHLTSEGQNPATISAGERLYDEANDGITFRSRKEIERFFAGLEIVPPYSGATPRLVPVGVWGAIDPELADDDGSRWLYAAVARKS